MSAPVVVTPVALERRCYSREVGRYIERIDFEPDLSFYGSSVAEGICPDIHDEDDLVEDGSRDRRPRRLSPDREGWLHCEEGCAPWRFAFAAEAEKNDG